MAVVKNKHITFSFILVCLIVVSPMAKAQLGLGGLLGGSSGLLNGILGGILGGAGGGLVGGLLNIQSIPGVLFCTLNGSLSPNTASTPAFSNADVQLQCGRQNTVVSSTTTNTAGIFSIPTSSIQMLLSTLLSDCKLAVITPLASCNSTLPAIGSLVSPLTIVRNTVSGVTNLIPAGFLLTG